MKIRIKKTITAANKIKTWITNQKVSKVKIRIISPKMM